MVRQCLEKPEPPKHENTPRPAHRHSAYANTRFSTMWLREEKTPCRTWASRGGEKLGMIWKGGERTQGFPSRVFC